MLKSKKYLMLIGISGALLILAVVGFLRISGAFWTAWDYQALDLFYKEAVKRGYFWQKLP